MKTFRMTMYGIVAASIVLASSGCHEWNRHGHNDGYYRDGSRYERNDRRWDDDNYRYPRYSRSDRRDWEWDRN